MIAAGEVIERPASVVKELLENSIDAGATRISVEIGGGGVELIRVADNGRGIAFDEMQVAFQRFATSKVADAADLDAIGTLGFRGEALPSIGAVAAVTLVSRVHGEDAGGRLNVVEGVVGERERHGTPPGTTVSVRRLFRSVPARRKFLRSPGAETSRINSLVTRYAMAYPEIAFELTVDGRRGFSSPGSGELREVIAAVYRPDTARAMIELEPIDMGEGEAGPQPHLHVAGMIGPPSVDRANRSYVSLFVNRRWVQNRALGFAVEQAYHGLMKERRYPVAVIDVRLPLSEVDVNFHPGKSEVRFRDESAAFGAVQRTVRQALTLHSPVPEVSHAPATRPHAAPPPRGPAFWPAEPFKRDGPARPAPTARAPSDDDPPQPAETPSQRPRRALPALRVLGQVQSAYVAAEGPDGVYLIDQHAAHERVVFERVRSETERRSPQSQSLLEPVLVELSPTHLELLQRQGQVIAGLGIVIEPFGDGAYLLRGVPSLLAGGDPAQALVDVLDTMADGGGFESWEDRAAYSIACHGAIRAGMTLTADEMTELARQLEECGSPHTCPHGRPTMIHLSSSQLEREFGRT